MTPTPGQLELANAAIGVNRLAAFLVHRSRMAGIHQDQNLSRQLANGLAELEPVDRRAAQFDFIMTSPPYWNMLRKSRGGVESKQKVRGKQGLDTHSSDLPADLGNIHDYDAFVERLGQVFDGLLPLLKPEKYLTIVVQNLRAPGGEVKPLAWDLTRRVSQTFQFQGEKIWCQNTKMLGIWGYPKTFVPNYHHHDCILSEILRHRTPDRFSVR